LKTIHSATSAPIPLKSNDVYESMSAPQSAGTAPPIVEPIKIATQIKARDGMTKAYDIRPAHALHDPLPGAGCKLHQWRDVRDQQPLGG
jgi:hypothetical protein